LSGLGQKSADSSAWLHAVARRGNAYKGYAGIIARRQYEPAGFKLALGFKDIRLALAAGEAAHVPLPFASILRDDFIDAIAHGDAAKDWSAVAEVAMRHAGLR